ncbi:hypothetical protein AKJ16_DCAP05986 [Drosera capensis]
MMMRSRCLRVVPMEGGDANPGGGVWHPAFFSQVQELETHGVEKELLDLLSDNASVGGNRADLNVSGVAPHVNEMAYGYSDLNPLGYPPSDGWRQGQVLLNVHRGVFLGDSGMMEVDQTGQFLTRDQFGGGTNGGTAGSISNEAYSRMQLPTAFYGSNHDGNAVSVDHVGRLQSIDTALHQFSSSDHVGGGTNDRTASNEAYSRMQQSDFPMEFYSGIHDGNAVGFDRVGRLQVPDSAVHQLSSSNHVDGGTNGGTVNSISNEAYSSMHQSDFPVAFYSGVHDGNAVGVGNVGQLQMTNTAFNQLSSIQYTSNETQSSFVRSEPHCRVLGLPEMEVPGTKNRLVDQQKEAQTSNSMQLGVNPTASLKKTGMKNLTARSSEGKGKPQASASAKPPNQSKKIKDRPHSSNQSAKSRSSASSPKRATASKLKESAVHCLQPQALASSSKPSTESTDQVKPQDPGAEKKVRFNSSENPPLKLDSGVRKSELRLKMLEEAAATLSGGGVTSKGKEKAEASAMRQILKKIRESYGFKADEHHITWDGFSEPRAQPVGFTCCLCELDLAFAPRGGGSASVHLPAVSILSCGHTYHSECLEASNLEVKSEDPKSLTEVFLLSI